MSTNSMKKTMPFSKGLLSDTELVQIKGLSSLLEQDDGMADAEIDSGDGQEKAPVADATSLDNTDLFIDQSATPAPEAESTETPPADAEVSTDTATTAESTDPVESAAVATEPAALPDSEKVGSASDEVQETKIRMA